MNVKLKRSLVFGIFLFLLLLLYVLTSSIQAGWSASGHFGYPAFNFSFINSMPKRDQYSYWPSYKLPKYNHKWMKKHCWADSNMSVSTLSKVLEIWETASPSQCKALYQKFTSIFDVRTLKTKVLIEGSFIAKVKHWLGDNEDLFKEASHQTIINVYNQFTHENVLINPLRDKRPIAKPEKPERQFVEELSKKAEANCDFCNFKEFTAKDDFDRIESKYSASASNTFKWDKWHGLILTKQHHPLNWNQEEFIDLMQTAMKWFVTVQKQDPQFKYPVIIWDLLPHASASQIHPHLHSNLNSGRYYGYVENWRSAGEMYYRDEKSNYFTDLAGVHQALGLSVQLGNATAFAHLVPRKDDEVVVISQTADNDFFKLIYFTLRAYLDDMEKFCFSLVIALPQMEGGIFGRLPAISRVVTRGPVSSMRSDISSVDLFMASNVNIDPYKVIGYIKKSVEKRNR